MSSTQYFCHVSRVPNLSSRSIALPAIHSKTPRYDGGLIAQIRRSERIKIPCSASVVIAFLALIMSPNAAATREELQDPTTRSEVQPHASSAEEPFDTAMRSLESRVLAVQGRVESAQLEQDQEALELLHAELEQIGGEIEARFEQERVALESSALPQKIMDRHADALAAFQAGFSGLLEQVVALCEADSIAEAKTLAAELRSMLDDNPVDRSHQPFDPNQLPFAPADMQPRAPQATDDGMRQQLQQDAERDRAEQAAAEMRRNPPMLASTSGVAQLAGLFAVSQAGGSSLADGDPAYLAPNEDVELTQDVIDLAESLDNQPVALFNWVYSNIEYIPGHRSIQGSQRTLETRRGNAFDQASLLIALYRAAGIPARYAYGTVEIEADRVRNWLGNLESPRAAVNLIGQGGTPVLALARGGEVNAVRMEHVWVEALVDFYPSRAAVNTTPDTWISLDPSFKQYEYSAGIDIETQVPFDTDSLVEDILSTAQVDEAAGTVDNIDTDAVRIAFEQYLADVETHIEQNAPQATVGEVIGTKTIVPRTADVLATGLPYLVRARGLDYATLPDSLRAYYSYELYSSKLDRQFGGPLFTFRRSLPALAGKRITLSFAPATDADRQVIESRLPEPNENGEIDPNQLPRSLPGYLIRLNAQIKVDGEVVDESGSFRMGHELSSTTAVTDLVGGLTRSNNELIAGEFYALGIHYPSGPQENLEDVRARLETARAAIEQQQFTGLTKDGLVGELLHAGITSYFAAVEAQNRIMTQSQPVSLYTNPGTGVFNTLLNPRYRFGIPFDVTFGGIGVDVNAVVTNGVANNNSRDELIQAIQLVGMQASALEHRIPELLFTDENNPGEGFSAVKALTRAAEEGQTIHTITLGNLSQALAAVNASSAVEAEIRANVLAGATATVHTSAVTVGGTTGFGYLLIDPTTGAGAYKISSGANGGSISVSDVSAGGLYTIIFGFVDKLFAVVGGLVDGVINALTLLKDCQGAFLYPALVLTVFLALLSVAVSFFALPFLVGAALAIIITTVNVYMTRRYAAQCRKLYGD